MAINFNQPLLKKHIYLVILLESRFQSDTVHGSAFCVIWCPHGLSATSRSYVQISGFYSKSIHILWPHVFGQSNNWWQGNIWHVYLNVQRVNASFCKRTQHVASHPALLLVGILQQSIWQACLVAKPLSCGVVRLKATALPPCSDALHSKTGFAVSLTNQRLCDKLF